MKRRLPLLPLIAAALMACACSTPEMVAQKPAVGALASNTQLDPPLQSDARQSTTGNPNRMICRWQGASGTRTAQARVCKTAREWEEQRVGAKDELEKHQRPPATR